jgi:transposase
MAHGVEVRRVRRSAEQWRRIVAEWTGSGLSQREFCRRRGFSLVTFGGWKRHFGDGARSACRDSHTAGDTRRLGGADRLSFVEVPHLPRAGAASLDTAVYEVRLANGRAVRVGPEFDPATLRRLLALVEAHGAGDGEARGC